MTSFGQNNTISSTVEISFISMDIVLALQLKQLVMNFCQTSYFKALQDVPDWIEEVAERALGTNYGPAGGKFASRDTRQVNDELLTVLQRPLQHPYLSV
jgi:hypothetical protein